jgi:hypothetical protein
MMGWSDGPGRRVPKGTPFPFPQHRYIETASKFCRVCWAGLTAAEQMTGRVLCARCEDKDVPA